MRTGIEPDHVLLNAAAYDVLSTYITDPRRGRALGKWSSTASGEEDYRIDGKLLVLAPYLPNGQIIAVVSANFFRHKVSPDAAPPAQAPEPKDDRADLWAVAWVRDGILRWRTLASSDSGLPLWSLDASKSVWIDKTHAEIVKKWWINDSMYSGTFLTVRWGDIFGDAPKARPAAVVEPAAPTFVIDGMKPTVPPGPTEWAVQSGDFYLAVSGLDGATWDEASRAQPMTRSQAEQMAENINRARAAARPSHMRGTSSPGAVAVQWPVTRAEPVQPAPAAEKINPAPPTSSMSLARARVIASGIADAFRSRALESHVEDPFASRVQRGGFRPLPECSLEEMLAAMRLVEESIEPETPRSGYPLRIAPKMIAAMYALERYGNFAKLREALGVF